MTSSNNPSGRSILIGLNDDSDDELPKLNIIKPKGVPDLIINRPSPSTSIQPATDGDHPSTDSSQSLEQINSKLTAMNERLMQLYKESQQEQETLNDKLSELTSTVKHLEFHQEGAGGHSHGVGKSNGHLGAPSEDRMRRPSALWGDTQLHLKQSFESTPLYKPKPAWPDRLKEHFSEISMECLPNIIATLSAGNIIVAGWWTILFLVMFGLNIGHTYYTLADYRDQPTVTNVIYKKTENLPYPQLVICGHYMVDRYMVEEAANMTWLDAQTLLYLFGVVPRSKSTTLKITSNVTDWWDNHLSADGAATPNMLEDFYAEFGLECYYLFSTCKDSSGREYDCCSLFRPVYHMFYGRCWAQNVTAFPVAEAPGVYSFFALRFSPFNNYENSEGEIVKDTDLHVFYGGIEQTWLSTNKVSLKSADLYQTWMELSPNVIESMPGKGYCEPNTTLEIFQEYTFANCMFEKQILLNQSVKAISDRNCTPIFYEWMKKNGSRLPDTLKKPYYCGPDDVQKVGWSNPHTIEYWLQNYNVTQSNPCAPPCSFTKYEVKKNTAQKEVAESMELLMLYTGMEYTNTVEKMRSEWYDYFSLIGGNLGLWLGASIVTFIYTFQGILVGLYSFCRKELKDSGED